MIDFKSEDLVFLEDLLLEFEVKDEVQNFKNFAIDV